MQNQLWKMPLNNNKLCDNIQLHQLASNPVQEFGKHIGNDEVGSSILPYSTMLTP
jgi:hypothetical protein